MLKLNKRIGILTTGGDCSGLNSVIRAAFIRSKKLGYELIGIKRGYRGLSGESPDYMILNDEVCNESMLSNSGTILLSDTKWMSSEIKAGESIEGIKNSIYEGYKALGLDGLICTGGDGSLHLTNELLDGNDEMKIVFIPKTIDNDVNHTDYSIGFQTSIEVVVEAIENIRSTARSHERAMVVEVMGRGAGFIAMYAGVASGADVILVPEFNYDIERLKAKVTECYSNGKNYCVVVVAESVEASDFKHSENFVDGLMKYTHLTYKGIGQHLVNKIKETGIDTRCVTLGHIQRGGNTCINDRLLGTSLGVEAVNLIAQGESEKILIFSGNKVRTMGIKDSLGSINRSLDKEDEYVKVARDLGVYIGEI